MRRAAFLIITLTVLSLIISLPGCGKSHKSSRDSALTGTGSGGTSTGTGTGPWPTGSGTGGTGSGTGGTGSGGGGGTGQPETIYCAEGAFATGTEVNGGSRTDGEIGTIDGTRIGWAKFDFSGIAPSSRFASVTVHYYIISTEYYSSKSPFTGIDPQATSGTVYTNPKSNVTWCHTSNSGWQSQDVYSDFGRYYFFEQAIDEGWGFVTFVFRPC
ncbi:MAG: hypothetical protein ACYS8W_04485 [Planctomycetota bacterium]|jgi:hypothetical protein